MAVVNDLCDFFFSLNVKGKLKNMRKFKKNEKSAVILNVHIS